MSTLDPCTATRRTSPYLSLEQVSKFRERGLTPYIHRTKTTLLPALASLISRQANPILSFEEASECSTTSRNGYNWGKDKAGQAQFGGSSIFGPRKTCADPNCAGPGDPQGLSAYSISQNFRTPYFYNYNLQVEKGLGNAAVFQVGYVGSQGRKLNLVSNINQNGAFPNFGSILQLNSSGTSNYNSLQALFKLRSWHGLTSQFAYTWAHALD